MIILAPTRLRPQCLVPAPEGMSTGMVDTRCWDVPGGAATWTNSVGRKASAHRAGHAHHPHSSAFPSQLLSHLCHGTTPVCRCQPKDRQPGEVGRAPRDEGNNRGHRGTTTLRRCQPKEDQSPRRQREQPERPCLQISLNSPLSTFWLQSPSLPSLAAFPAGISDTFLSHLSSGKSSHSASAR